MRSGEVSAGLVNFWMSLSSVELGLKCEKKAPHVNVNAQEKCVYISFIFEIKSFAVLAGGITAELGQIRTN